MQLKAGADKSLGNELPVLTVFSVAQVEFSAAAEYLKGFFPG